MRVRYLVKRAKMAVHFGGMDISHIVSIASHESELEFSRSQGAGGQNVNKVNSKCTLRWNLVRSGVPDEVKSRLFKKIGGLLTVEGDLLVSSQETRDQVRNRAICFEKLELILQNALKVQKKRRATKPTYSSVQRRLDSKKRRSATKHQRRIRDED